MAPDWAEALAPVDDRIAGIGRFLRAELAEGRTYLPAGDDVFKAFRRPLAGVRVLVVGQDPYPTPGHPIGLSFAVAPDVRPLPGSLRNIYQELSTDLGVPPAPHGDLTTWADRGVMLLNRVLTVRPGESASHRPDLVVDRRERLGPVLRDQALLDESRERAHGRQASGAPQRQYAWRGRLVGRPRTPT